MPVFADKKVIACVLCFINFVVYSMRNPVVYRTAKKVVFCYVSLKQAPFGCSSLNFKNRVLPTTRFLHYQVLHSKQPRRKLYIISIWVFLPDDKSIDSSLREGIQLDALNWSGREYVLHIPKSVSRKRSKAWALSRGLCFLTWGDFHARSRFALCYPREKIGTRLLVV